MGEPGPVIPADARPRCRGACGSPTTRRRADGCCSRRNGSSRLTRSPSRSSSAVPAKRPSARSSTTWPRPFPPHRGENPCGCQRAVARLGRQEAAGIVTKAMRPRASQPVKSPILSWIAAMPALAQASSASTTRRAEDSDRAEQRATGLHHDAATGTTTPGGSRACACGVPGWVKATARSCWCES